MAETAAPHPRRVYLPHALGADEHLRATWHERERVVVFSHWRGEHCIASTPVPVTASSELTTLLVQAMAHAATTPQAGPVVEPPVRGRGLRLRWAGLRGRLHRGRVLEVVTAAADPTAPIRWADSA